MRVLCHQWLGLIHTIQNAVQLCSVHMLVRLCSKSFKLDFISKQTQNFQMYSGFWKGKWTRDQIANIHWIILKLRELKKKPSTSASLTMLNLCVQFSCSVVSDFLPPHELKHQASLSITNCQSLPKPMFIESVMPSNHLILCHPLLLLP